VSSSVAATVVEADDDVEDGETPSRVAVVVVVGDDDAPTVVVCVGAVEPSHSLLAVEMHVKLLLS
jgi:hypothetical protein